MGQLVARSDHADAVAELRTASVSLRVCVAVVVLSLVVAVVDLRTDARRRAAVDLAAAA